MKGQQSHFREGLTTMRVDKIYNSHDSPQGRVSLRGSDFKWDYCPDKGDLWNKNVWSNRFIYGSWLFKKNKRCSSKFSVCLNNKMIWGCYFGHVQEFFFFFGGGIAIYFFYSVDDFLLNVAWIVLFIMLDLKLINVDK